MYVRVQANTFLWIVLAWRKSHWSYFFPYTTLLFLFWKFINLERYTVRIEILSCKINLLQNIRKGIRVINDPNDISFKRTEEEPCRIILLSLISYMGHTVCTTVILNMSLYVDHVYLAALIKNNCTCFVKNLLVQKKFCSGNWRGCIRQMGIRWFFNLSSKT